MLFALKQLLRHPVYSIGVVMVLATGLGAAISLYAVSNTVLFRPLNVQEPDSLVRVLQTDRTHERRYRWALSGIRERLHGVDVFEDVAFFLDTRTYTHALPDGTSISFEGGLASGNFFQLLGVKPFLGRLLRSSDNVRGGAVVAVLSWNAWQSRFAGDPAVIGSSIVLNTRVVTIVGVTPPGFHGVSLVRRPDIWLPVLPGAGIAMGESFERNLLGTGKMPWLDVVARLQPGTTVEQANLALQAACPDCSGERPGSGMALVVPARDVAVNRFGDSDAERVSWLLLGLVGVLLLIVCADVAGLMLVRAESQRVETGVRMTLGADRGRIVLQVLRETFLISGLAGVLALLFALGTSRWLHQVLAGDLILDGFDMILNRRVMTAFGVMLLVTVLLSGLAPMRRLLRMPVAHVLQGARQGARRATGFHELLVALQIGLSTALLGTAMAFASAVHGTLSVDPGFTIEDRALASIDANATTFDARTGIFRELLRKLREDGRVKSAALAGSVPVEPAGFRVVGHDVEGFVPRDGETTAIDVNLVSDGYFRTLDIPLLRGRDFQAHDFDGEGGAAIVNRAFVDAYWPGRQPLGLTIGGMKPEGERIPVVGVVENNRQHALREPPRPMVYIPYTEISSSGINAVVHAENPRTALLAIRDAAREARAALAEGTGMSLRERLDRFTARDRALTLLAAGAAGFATLLAVAGMYGIAAYTARQRQREIGIRFAVGATRARIMHQFLRRGLVVAVAGIISGLLLALFSGRYLAGVIAGVGPDNAPFVLGAGALLALIALLANLFPVWRAADIAPMEVLRDE